MKSKHSNQQVNIKTAPAQQSRDTQRVGKQKILLKQKRPNISLENQEGKGDPNLNQKAIP